MSYITLIGATLLKIAEPAYPFVGGLQKFLNNKIKPDHSLFEVENNILPELLVFRGNHTLNCMFFLESRAINFRFINTKDIRL